MHVTIYHINKRNCAQNSDGKMFLKIEFYLA